MTKRKLTFLIVIFILVTISCNTVSQQTDPTSAPTQPVISTIELSQPQQGQDNLPQTEEDVPRVNVEDAKLAFENSEAVIVDVRSVEAYAEGHIAGAISIPLDEFENNIANVPLDINQWIITYCT